MNDKNVHPLIRYGGPILGAVIVYFIITSMIGGFQADMEAARLEPLPLAEEVALAGEGAEPAAAEAPVEGEAVAEEALPEVSDSAAITETETVTETETLTETAPIAETAEVTETVELEIEAAAPVTETEVVTETVPVEVPTPAPTEVPPTPEAAAPSSLAELSKIQIYAGLPAQIASFFPDGVDAEAGEQTALSSGCTACHSLLPDVVQVGPSWYGAGDHAVTRVPGQSPALYLYTSITDPEAFIVPDFPPGLMPNIYNQLLTDEQIANIVAYLLTLEEE
jgi:mono/diheme cytochrome c family protein